MKTTSKMNKYETLSTKGECMRELSYIQDYIEEHGGKLILCDKSLDRDIYRMYIEDENEPMFLATDVPIVNNNVPEAMELCYKIMFGKLRVWEKEIESITSAIIFLNDKTPISEIVKFISELEDGESREKAKLDFITSFMRAFEYSEKYK